MEVRLDIFQRFICKKKYPEHKITLIESSKIPIIGVGEATTPILLKFLHHDLGFEAAEFYKEVQPTLKTAIRFIWGQPNHDFFNGFGPTSAVQTVFEFGDTTNATINSVLLKDNKTPFLKQGDKIVPIKIPNVFAYHLDNKRLVTFLKKKFSKRNIGYWDCEIADFHQNPNSGNIETVISKEGEQKNFDYFFDCSGFKSILIKEKLQSK